MARPWLSLTPSFATGGAIPELVDQGLLHPSSSRIFRGENHRREAVEARVTVQINRSWSSSVEEGMYDHTCE